MCRNLADFEKFLALLAFGIAGMSVPVQKVTTVFAAAGTIGTRGHSVLNMAIGQRDLRRYTMVVLYDYV